MFDNTCHCFSILFPGCHDRSVLGENIGDHKLSHNHLTRQGEIIRQYFESMDGNQPIKG